MGEWGFVDILRKNSDDVIQPEERRIIEKCISSGDVVFDVGAHHSLLSKAVLSHATDIDLHIFEASKKSYAEVVAQLGDRATINHSAASHTNGQIVFNTYQDDDRLSSVYRRTSVEEELLPSGFDANVVPAVALDGYWTEPKRQINFLKIDVEGAEYDVLRRANRLLKAGQIDYIQFEYGGTFQDAGFTLAMCGPIFADQAMPFSRSENASSLRSIALLPQWRITVLPTCWQFTSGCVHGLSGNRKTSKSIWTR